MASIPAQLTPPQAVNNFFHEQAVMRRTAITLPKGTSDLWTPAMVCGEVYQQAIKDLTEEMTRLPSGSKEGWITEYNKASAAIFHTLSAEERATVTEICDAWNTTGIPKELKAK